MSCNARHLDAIKCINASLNTFENVFYPSYAEHMAWAVIEQRDYPIEYIVHGLLGFAQGAPDGYAVKRQGVDVFC